jgi:hypothetical protein
MGVQRFSLATNAERVCVEIMRKYAEIMRKYNDHLEICRTSATSLP